MIRIIYQDEDIIAVNKPVGIPVHPDRHHTTGTLIQELAGKFPEIKNVGEDPMRPGIVHRLDKDTSGVLIIARNQKSFEILKKQFQERKVKKEYYALVVGRMKDKRGIIDLPIGRSKHDPTLRVAKGLMRGTIREALTEYRVKEYFSYGGEEYTLLSVFPKTGRTHQIRAHFKAINHPVVCDTLYSGKRLICPFGLSRHFLHACALELLLPSGTKIRLEAEMPEDLLKVLEELRKERESDRVVKS